MKRLFPFAMFLIAALVTSGVRSGGWDNAKNTADDVIYKGKDRTFYCGCKYTSHGDNDGSRDVTHTAIEFSNSMLSKQSLLSR